MAPFLNGSKLPQKAAGNACSRTRKNTNTCSLAPSGSAFPQPLLPLRERWQDLQPLRQKPASSLPNPIQNPIQQCQN